MCTQYTLKVSDNEKMTPQYQSENYLYYLRYLDIYNQSNYFTYTYNCSDVIVYNTLIFLIKAPLLRCATIMNKALRWCLLFKITNTHTAHHSCTYRVIYNSIQNITYTLIIKPINLIQIMKKYLDIRMYLFI